MLRIKEHGELDIAELQLTLVIILKFLSQCLGFGGKNDLRIKTNAEKVLKRIASLECINGEIKGWGGGFDENKHAFTHNLASNLRGLLESAIILKME